MWHLFALFLVGAGLWVGWLILDAIIALTYQVIRDEWIKRFPK